MKNRKVYWDSYLEVSVYRVKGDNELMEFSNLEPVDTIVIPSELFREGSIVIINRGDSMEKLIMDGTNVVIDTTKRDIMSGGIYALSIPWEGCIIRECHSEHQGLLLRTYNKNYPESTVTWGEFEPDMVIGEVYCSVINVFR